ncbi:Uridine 5'-monophosphate synthase [Trichoplax sp. H2]|nr:Uridine 5'-monophosphate synthase [Trichoplax sp. H2]|eukprot:RDD38898.1 Uridine 5'-monophosphate synthase [Trichoplax sp. H2]
MAATLLSSLRSILLQLFDSGAIKFADPGQEFTLKSGAKSPAYFNLRTLNNNAKLREEASGLMWQACQLGDNATYDCICGVPLGAICYADAISLAHDLPLVLKRPFAKQHGVSKKLVDSDLPKGSNCLVVEDVVTSGTSVIETVTALRDAGFVVTHAVTFIDREQGGKERLGTEYNVHLSSVCTGSQVLDILYQNNKISTELKDYVQQYLSANNMIVAKEPPVQAKQLNFQERALLTANPVAKKLLNVMTQKSTNLIFSADVDSLDTLLDLASIVGPHICAIKTHINTFAVENFKLDLIYKLRNVADEQNFLILEDSKFADIGNTVYKQYVDGYHICEWADFVTAHAVSGPGVIEALVKGSGNRDRACLLIAQMSSDGNLASEAYTNGVLKIAEDHSGFVAGFICRQKLSSKPNFIHITPGVKLAAGMGTLGQQYLTPDEVIKNRQSDVVIVGSGIYQAEDPLAATIAYKEAAFAAYNDLL